MSLGTRIYEQRTAHSLSQTDLAGLLEVSRQSISKWETDASVPELDKLVKMCEVFGVSLDRLVLDREPAQPAPAVQPAPAARTLAAPQSIIGLVLIALGLFIFLLMAENFGADSDGMLLALPFLALGTLCLIIRGERLLLGFGWVLIFARLGISLLSFSPVLSVPLFALVFFLLSLPFAWLISLIPGVGPRLA